MDLKKLTTGEKVVAGSGVLLLIFSFFTWYGASVSLLGRDVGYSLNGWDAPDSFFSVIAILLGVVMAAHVIATKLFNVEIPNLGNLGWGLLHLILGVVAAIFLVLKYLMNTDGPEKIGFYLAILAGIGLAVGGYLMAKERGELPAQLGGTASTPPAA